MMITGIRPFIDFAHGFFAAAVLAIRIDDPYLAGKILSHQNHSFRPNKTLRGEISGGVLLY